MADKPPLKTALIYDFDGTLARGNMQEVTFIPSIGMGIGDFWSEAEALTRAADGDGILMYMQLMLQHARQNDAPITRADRFDLCIAPTTAMSYGR